jgi:hypothetical protein
VVQLLSFRVVNLIVPNDPAKLALALPSGTWTLEQCPDFGLSKHAVTTGNQCAETYFIEHPVSMDQGSAAVDKAFDEITPLLLAAAYLTGLSVTIERSTPTSDVSVLQATEHWPRARAIGPSEPVVTSPAEFSTLVLGFVQSWPSAARTEKARLLVHHWLDALSCWSMEDLYLSTTTLLQVIVASEAAKQRKRELQFFPGLIAAARRVGIRALSDDFKNMRNELVHDGQLIGRRFAGPDKNACAEVVADVLNWFDEYLHAALGFGAPRKLRFPKRHFAGLNAYSIE